jgi:serine/threonine protein phosphatase PrpC
MFTPIADLYRQNLWFKISVGVTLLLSGEILLWTSGGFPPWAWRFLFQVLSQLPALWSTQGSAILIPLLGLFLLSLALLLMWLVIIICLVKMVLSWWHEYSAGQDLQEAEELSARMFQQEVSRQRPERVSSRATRTAQLNPATYPPSPRSVRPSSEPTAQPRSTAPARSVYQPVSQQSTAQPVRTYQPTVEAVRSESFEAAWQPRAVPLFPQNEASAQQYSVARASRPVRAAAGQNYPTSYPSASAAAPPVRRDQLHIVPREPLESLEEDPPDYETLFEIEHPLIKTSDPRIAFSNAAKDIHTDSLNESASESVHTEDLQNDLRLVVGIGLDPGIARKDAPNEDNLFAIQAMRAGKNGSHPVGLFIVADGMGGHADGQEASRLAIQVISDAIVPVLMRVDADEDSFSDLLKDGVHRANLALYRRNREQPEMMGTTLTAALLVDDQAYIANIGDSRTYLYRPQEGLRQVTRDHSLVAQLVEQGHITRDEIYTHPRRNQIYRCLGEKPSVEVDNFHITIQRDDVLMLCSDGLWEMVHDKTIQQIIASSSTHPSQISSMLVQSALSRGGADNISVVIVCVTQPEDQS